MCFKYTFFRGFFLSRTYMSLYKLVLCKGRSRWPYTEADQRAGTKSIVTKFAPYISPSAESGVYFHACTSRTTETRCAGHTSPNEDSQLAIALRISRVQVRKFVHHIFVRFIIENKLLSSLLIQKIKHSFPCSILYYTNFVISRLELPGNNT